MYPNKNSWLNFKPVLALTHAVFALTRNNRPQSLTAIHLFTFVDKMALRPLHLLLALALLMIYFETTSSTEENEVYAQEENELETVDELVPRSPGRRRRWGHTAYSRRVGYSRRHGPRQRVRYSRRHGPRQRVRYSRRHGPRQRVRYSRRVRFHRISRKPRKRVGRRIRVHRPGIVGVFAILNSSQYRIYNININ